MTLRRYQAESVEKTLAALEKCGSAVLQMPTGAGKTKTAMEIVAGHDGVVWFLCHRKEIIRQAAKAFRAAGIDFGVISPAKDPETGKKYEFQPEKRVQIASVGSIGRRIGKLPVPSLVIWDECHHTPAASWRAIRDRTQAAKHVGLTATPERQDGAGLRELFDEMIVGPSIKELVDDGWLSRFRYFAPSEPDLSAARMQAGDYRKGDIEKVMNTPVLIGDAVSEYKKSIPGKRALVFAVSVDASRALVEKFREEGIAAAHVDANTPDDERDAAVADLASGKIKVLSNVEVFTEGFDIPAIDAVILMRPTRSVRLLLQMIGRALRIAEGKDCAMLFDHAGLYHEHGWFADNWHWSLDGGAAKERRRALERGPRKCPECNEVRAEREPVCACGFEFPSGREVGEFDGVLREIRGEVPEGCETQTAFAKRLGYVPVTVCYWVKSGMPNIGGFPLIGAADDWASARQKPTPPEGCETKEDFTRRCGVASGTAVTWARRGMPMRGDFVPVDEALDWVVGRAKGVCPSGYSKIGEFAKTNCVSYSQAKSWMARGMPHRGILVDVAGAKAWMDKNVITKAIPDGCVSKADFARRIGRSESGITNMIARGMPNVGGYPVLSDALIWVKQKIRGKPDDDNVYKETFARMLGRSGPYVDRLIREGLPLNRGLINVVAAKAWIAENVESRPADNDNDAASKAA